MKNINILEEKDEFDVTGRNQYLSVCRTLGVVPSSYFLRHMQDSVLSLRHHGIGSLGAKAISFPLMVGPIRLVWLINSIGTSFGLFRQVEKIS